MTRQAIWFLALGLLVSMMASCQPASTPTAQAPATPMPRPAASPTAVVLYDVPLPSPTPAAVAAVTATATSPAPEGEMAALPAEGIRFTILHTNDSRGYVDPCG